MSLPISSAVSTSPPAYVFEPWKPFVPTSPSEQVALLKLIVADKEATQVTGLLTPGPEPRISSVPTGPTMRLAPSARSDVDAPVSPQHLIALVQLVDLAHVLTAHSAPLADFLAPSVLFHLLGGGDGLPAIGAEVELAIVHQGVVVV